MTFRADFVVEVETALDRALDRWSRLEAHGIASAFQSSAYLSAWFASFEPEPPFEPLFVFVKVGAEDAVALPLVREKKGLLSRIAFADDEAGDYAVALVDRGRAGLPDFDLLWPPILAALPPSDYVELLKIPGMPWLPGPDLSRLPGLERLRTSAHPLAIPPGGADPADALLGARVRADLRRRRKRLEELGRIGFRLATDPGEAKALCERMFGFRTARFAAIKRTDALGDGRLRQFYLDLCGRQPGLAVVSGLVLEDEPIAVQYGLLHDGRYYQIITGFSDGPWSVLAPGRLLMLDTLRWCAARNVAVYDFTYGDERYKDDFGAAELPLLRHVRARSPKGRLYLAALSGRRRLYDLWDSATVRLAGADSD